MPLPREKEDLIKRYIEIGLQRGYSRDQVKKKFMSHGYSGDLFEEIYAKYFAPKTPLQKAQPVQKVQKKKSRWGIVITMVVVLLLLIVGAYVALQYVPSWSLTTKKCTTNECFVTAAQQCEPLQYKHTIEGTIFFDEITRDCVFHKRVFAFGPEPDAVKELLANKTLMCSYQKGAFDPNWIDSLTIGLEKCQGSLKDAFFELLGGTVAK